MYLVCPVLYFHLVVFLEFEAEEEYLHRHVKSVVIAGSAYTAFLPVPTPDYTADAPSIMRKIDAENPVIDVNSVDYTCGKGAGKFHFFEPTFLRKEKAGP